MNRSGLDSVPYLSIGRKERTIVHTPRTPRTPGVTPRTPGKGGGQSQKYNPNESSYLEKALSNTRLESTTKTVSLPAEAKASAVIGHRVFIGLRNGTIAVCDARTGELLRESLSEYAKAGIAVWCLLAIGDQLWVGYSDGTIEVHDTQPTHRVVHTLQKHTGGVYCMTEFSGVVYSGSNDFEIFQWDVKLATFTRLLAGHTNYVRCLLGEGSGLYSGSDDSTVRVWDVATGNCIHVLNHHKAGLSCFIRVGANIWSADDSGKILVWDVATYDMKATLREHDARVICLRKIGSRVYSGGADHEVLMWDCSSWQLLGKVVDHRGWVTCVINPAVQSKYHIWTTSHDNTLRKFCHEEYHIVTADRARFDDRHWYHSCYNPYEDLSKRLQDHNSLLEAKGRATTVEAALALGKLDGAEAQMKAVLDEKSALHEEYVRVCEELRDVKDGHIPRLQSAVKTKEAALELMTTELTRVKDDVIKLKYSTVETDALQVETQRNVTLLQSENSGLRAALDDLRTKHKEQLEKDTAQMIRKLDEMRTEYESGSSKMAEELRVALLLNDSLRDQTLELRKQLDISQAKAAIFTRNRRPLSRSSSRRATTMAPRPPSRHHH